MYTSRVIHHQNSHVKNASTRSCSSTKRRAEGSNLQAVERQMAAPVACELAVSLAMGYPKWLVYFMENPIYKWKMANICLMMVNIWLMDFQNG